MKKLSILFIGCFCITLISCKARFDNLAANSNDDVYYNPAKDPRPVANTQQNNNNVAQNNSRQQNNQQGYNPNAGKIAATHADSMNPNYKDPKFNYDDYYDNAYAARVSRFQNPIYGTGYYDSYYTNQYSYTGNPSQYGNSIYNNYPSSMYNSYNNYGMGNGMSGYNSYGNSMYGNSMYGGGYGSGYGSSLSIGYSSGYGMGYNPFGSNYGYNPYGGGYGMGYNPYGMSGYYGSMGYNPYGMGYNPYGMGYGMGYCMGGYSGYNPYSTMSTGGYYNPYDYNSTGGSTYNGPRGSHTGGNSTTTSNGPRGVREEAPIVNNPTIHHLDNPMVAAAPTSVERFNQVSIPKENMVKIAEEKAPTRFNSQYQSLSNNPVPVNNNNGGFQPTSGPRNTFNPNQNVNNTNYQNNGKPAESVPVRQTRWFSGNSNNTYENNNTANTMHPVNNNFENNFSAPTPRNSSWGGNSGSFGGAHNSGGSFGGGGGGGHAGGRR